MIANLERHAIRHIGIVSVSMEYIFSKCIHIYIYLYRLYIIKSNMVSKMARKLFGSQN